LFGVALIWASLTVMSAEITGRVVGVSDGDTITVLVGGNESVKVRLVGIDAPEKAQSFGAVSKRNLSDHVYGKSV
jgi:endonuclease YncB( thermonuclease family)